MIGPDEAKESRKACDEEAGFKIEKGNPGNVFLFLWGTHRGGKPKGKKNAFFPIGIRKAKGTFF